MKKIFLILSIICLNFSVNAQEKEISVSNDILQTYVGKYELGPNAIIDVTKDKKQLFVQLTGQSKFEIFPSSEIKFFLKVVEATVTFNKDEKGNVISLTLNQNGRDISGNKVE